MSRNERKREEHASRLVRRLKVRKLRLRVTKGKYNLSSSKMAASILVYGLF
jgi:anti-sigma28 factor (negative regulator of flagellin synthesis)